MPICGIGLGLPYGGTGVDRDALSYFSRAGISSDALTPSAYQNASTFNGTNQQLTLADNTSIRLNSTDFSFSCWVNPTSITGNHTIFGKGPNASNGAEYMFQVSTGSGARFAYNVSGTWYTSNASVVSTGVWTHFVFVVSGSNLTIYKNGVSSATWTLPAGVGTSTSAAGFGADNSQEFFNGSIGQTVLWKRALTSGEVSTMYNNGSGITYAASTSLSTSMVSWWDLSETSGNRADSFGSNTLTNNNSVGSTQGPIVTATANSRALILEFIKGVKVLGLWNNFVCWPLRSSQNASTTLTAQSLGGLGTYNASLTNGGVGAWGVNGLTTNGSSGSYLYVPTYPVVTTPHSLFGVNTLSTAGSSGGFANIITAGGLSGSLFGRFNLFGFTAISFLITGSSLRALTGGNNQRATPDTNRNHNSPYYRAGSYNTDLTAISHIIDGSVIHDGAPTSGTGNLPFTNFNTGLNLLVTQLNGVTNTSPFIGLANGYLTSSQHNEIRNLYKSTLGVGLPLA